MARNSRARKSSQHRQRGPTSVSNPKKTKSMAELMGIPPINFVDADPVEEVIARTPEETINEL